MNAHTKQQQDKVFETDFIDSHKSDPPFAHLLAVSHHDITDKVALDKLEVKAVELEVCSNFGPKYSTRKEEGLRNKQSTVN